MNYLTPLFSLQRKIFRNTYWHNRRQRIITALIIGAAVGATVGVAYLFKRFVLVGFLDPVWLLDPIFGPIVFGLVVALIFFVTLTQSMADLIPRFYRSPDLNYLLALPIPANQVLALKFLTAQLQSSRAVLFISLVVLIATGWSIGAPWYYYAALLPIFGVVTLIPAGIGLLIGMALLRVMTAKTFTRFAGVLSFGTVIVWFAGVGMPMEQLMPFLARAMELFEWLRHIPVDLIPLVAAGKLLNGLAIAEPVEGLRPLLMLLLVTGVTMFLIFRLARHLFLQGWLVTQSAPTTAKPRKAVRSGVRRRARTYPPLIAAVLTEWRRALRNEEMQLVFFAILAGYVAIVFVLLINGDLLDLLGGSPTIALVMIVLYAAVLLPMGIGLLFTSQSQLTQVGTSKAAIALFKRTMWLTKALPFTTTEVVLIAVLKTIMPPFLLGAAGILIYALLAEVAFVHVLLAVTGLLLLLLGSSFRSTAQDFWGYARTINPMIDELLWFIIPVVYFTAAAGPLTLYLLGAIPWLAFFQLQPLLIGGLISWSAVSLLAIWGGWKLAARSWEEIEID